MLREIQKIAYEPGMHRRWFQDDDFDVFLWLTPSGEVTSFQVCYSIGPDERALAWHQHAGLFHDGMNGGAIASPPAFDLARFEEAALGLPRTVRITVKRHIREYVEGRLPAASRRRRFRREIWQNAPAE